MGRHVKLTLLLFLWWSAVAAVYAEMFLSMARLARPDLTIRTALIANWLGWLLWVPLSMLFIAAVERRPIQTGNLRPALATAVACIVLAILAKAAFVWVVNDSVPLWYQHKPAFAGIVGDSIRNNLILAILVIGAAHAIHYARANADSRVRIAALESGLARAQLDALAAQINPHFLFNALNTIAETLHTDPRAADGMIVNLSTLLRESLRRDGEHLIPLSEEIGLLEYYLALQRLRFGSRLVTDIAVTASCQSARVPRLMLQPLAENAIIHGIANRIEGGRVRLKIYDDHETLIIQMGNDGPFVPGAREQAGIGLDNVRRRLETLFDNTASLQIETADEDWTEVTIRQPLILSPVA